MLINIYGISTLSEWKTYLIYYILHLISFKKMHFQRGISLANSHKVVFSSFVRLLLVIKISYLHLNELYISVVPLKKV